jgi:alpha-ketoglutarate-dependent taurine dioxygenase
MNHSITLRDRWLRVRFEGGAPTHGDFHYLWLRHNCDQDLHPATRERVVDASEFDEAIRPRDAWIEGGDTLVIHWDEPSERCSRYALAWLRAHAYAPGRVDPGGPDTDLAGITLDAAALGDALFDHALARLSARGVARIVGYRPRGEDVGPEDTEALIDELTARGLAVIGTHFGRIEDLRTDNRTNANNDQLGYTDAAIDLHTDQPFLEEPPHFQALHCLQPAPVGGDTALVDARALSELLRAEDADAWEMLRTVPVVFHRKQRSFEKVLSAPVLGEDGPSGFRARYSYFTLAPFRVPFAQMERWYRAHRRFARMVRDPRHQLRFRLEAGDVVLYDNHRMLHARTGFTGPRWLRGVYFDREGERTAPTPAG